MKILSIALNTFRENLRDKLLYNLLVFALLMIGSSVLLSRLTLGAFASGISWRAPKCGFSSPSSCDAFHASPSPTASSRNGERAR